MAMMPPGGRSAAAEVFPAGIPEPGWLGRQPLGGFITWTGCAGFILELEGTRICFDPFATNPGALDLLLRPARSDTGLVRRTFGTVSAVFVGHTHFDHAMDVAALARANPRANLGANPRANPGGKVHGSATTTEICRRQGLPDEQLRTVWDGYRTSIGPFTVEAIESRHGVVPIASAIDTIELRGPGLPRTAFRWPRGEVYAYRVEVAGLSLHVQTSAGIADEPLARQQPADVLIACLAARQRTPRYLRRLGEVLRPTVLIPCHHDNFLRPLSSPPRPVAGLDWPGFLDDADGLRADYRTRLVQLPRGVPVAL
jgi:L-ascorbate metabolism protein UlaG (beta-lactamase superfamily)